VGKTRIGREVAARVVASGRAVLTVVGTRAAAVIPFAPFASFVPADHADLTPLGLFGLVRDGLAGPGVSPSLLVVDDAQRLDSGSAALVHQLVAERVCPVLATVRSGEVAPDAISGLWKDSLAERVELGGLNRAEVDELVAAVLRGPVDGATLRRIWQSTRGNLLFVRELVGGAVAGGALRAEDGVWRLSSNVPIPARLAELITGRLIGLAASTRAALDVIAVAERLDIHRFERLGHLEAVDELDRLGFVEVLFDSEVALVALRHPLFGEAVRAAMSHLRRRRVCAELADAAQGGGVVEASDLVRVVTWRLEAGQLVDAGLLTAAAQRAWMSNDLALAERLATAARSVGAGFDAGLVLADVAIVSGRPDDALARFGSLAEEATTDEQRVRVAGGQAYILSAQLGREVEAIDVIEGALRTVTDTDSADMLRGRLATIHMLAARPRAALDAARPVLDRRASPALYKATYAASLASAMYGRLDDAVQIGTIGYATHQSLDEVVRLGAETQHIGPILALSAAGRVDEAAELASGSYNAAVAGRDEESQATFALLRGYVAVQQGRTTTATVAFREALAINRQINDIVALRWALGGVALTAGQRGDRLAAEAVVTELASHPPLATMILELDLVERGRAWAQFAAGEHSSAAATLRAAAQQAMATEQLVAEAWLRHDLVRLGQARSEQPRLAELASMIDGVLINNLAEHARALATGDGFAVDEVAHQLAALGNYGLAIEAAAQASKLLKAAGYRRRASAAEALATQLLASCETTPSPLVGFFDEARLTAREREIASLAGHGLSNREIAKRLVVSPRTIENHLNRIFVKLGITSRNELPTALQLSPQ
jgi:DNA-binding CsgD family transcriptional regulator